MGKTYIGFLLDETGSMGSVRDATISGFNEYIGTLKADKANSYSATLVKFNACGTATVFSDTTLAKVPDLTQETYSPACRTPLYDAIGGLIHQAETELKGRKQKPVVLIVIMTDGLENASKEYDRQRIFDLIKTKEADGWTFVYLGANQDAWAVAASIGVQASNSVTYDAAMPKQAFSVAADAAMNYASTDGAMRRGLTSNMTDDKGNYRTSKR